MHTLEKIARESEATWGNAVLAPPGTRNLEERKSRRIRSLAGTALGTLAGAGVGALADRYTELPGGPVSGAAMGSGIGGSLGYIIGSKNILDRRESQGDPVYRSAENRQGPPNADIIRVDW